MNAYLMFKKAANNGYVKGKLNLALMHYNKKYNMLDFEKSYSLLTEAVSEEYDKAYYYMGKFYEEGIYCQQDSQKAIYWFAKSARNAYKGAYKKLLDYNVTLEIDL